MRGFQLDWRWVALIIFIALLANGRSLPWPVTALALGGGGVYLLVMSWRSAGLGGRGGGGGRGRVTYWRGQRIEMPGTPRRRPAAWSELAPAVVYALIGLALLFGAISIVLNQVLLPGVV
ncbi:hypothetical protein EKD04_019795 [Chloroflexales bacterium ZM16-3]|nr:hypothetical protein [Chloroflexales bacterium ZM16-3]